MTDPLQGTNMEEHDNSDSFCGQRCWYQVPADIKNLTDYEVDTEASFTVTLAQPTSKMWLWQEEMDSLLTACLRLQHTFPNIHLLKDNESDLCVSAIRNRMVERFLQSNSSILIFLDYDMVFHPDSLTKIVKSLQHPDLAVYSCAYFSRAYPFSAFVADDRGQWIEGNGQLPVGVQEVIRFGTGCIGIKREVFMKLQRPFFRLTYSETGTLLETEDCYFGRKLEELHIKAYIDTSVLCQHLRIIQIPKFFESKHIQCDTLRGRIRTETPDNALVRNI